MLTFTPPRWLKSPHLQTIGAAAPLFTPAPAQEEDPLRFVIGRSSRTGREHLLHASAWWAEAGAPAVIILHGIAGSKDSHCCIRAAAAVHRAGYHAVRVDMRGAGESVVDAPSLYHAGITSDLDVVIRELRKDARISGIFILGFSGGGGQALKLAAAWGEDSPEGVLGIATASAPLDYPKVAARMDRLACLPYRFHVLRGLVDRARAFAQHHPLRALYRPADLDRIKRFREFDSQIIVPMHGFSDVDAYYADASAGPRLGTIRVPTLIIHSEDDPMVPIETVRPYVGRASSAVSLSLSAHGGHLGWLGGLDESSWINGWATNEALSFFASVTPPKSYFLGGRAYQSRAPRRHQPSATDLS